LNEAKNLPHVLSRLPGEIFEVILVDGLSIDTTMEVARTLCRDVRFIKQTRPGKGNALACGFAAARGDIIVMLDADGSADPAEIPRFVEALCGGADFAKGSRCLPGGGSSDITVLRNLGNRALTTLVNLLFHTRYTDLCYGYNAFWTHCLPYLDVDCDGFEVETLINIRASKGRLVIAEVPSFEGQRIHGVSNLHAVRDGLRVLRTILRERSGTVDRLVAATQAVRRYSGPERRNSDDRRCTAERRAGRPHSIDRRSFHGRRASDRGVDLFIPGQPDEESAAG
jgi:glycosyltransferase involved in cell wall biosynthesis